MKYKLGILVQLLPIYNYMLFSDNLDRIIKGSFVISGIKVIKHLNMNVNKSLYINNLKKSVLLLVLLNFPFSTNAFEGMPTPPLHVEGRYLKDPHGNIVNLHGVAMTPSPWFNGCMYGMSSIYCTWDNYDTIGCLDHNKAVMDKLTDTLEGWYLSYIRLHIDPYWTNTPGAPIPENDISRFSYSRLVDAVDKVIVPLIEHARSRGMYVILRPPGVCPERIAVGDDYHNYLLTVWGYLSQHRYLKNSDHVMFELANEPVDILGTDSIWGSNSQAHFDALKLFFQSIVDTIRNNGANNIIWIPGAGWQSHYKGYAVNPIEGGNIGYAVHIYPGFWGGVNNYESFQGAWDENVKPVADFAPIAVTEIDWSPDGEGTWGVATTGVAGGEGFGANFNFITNESGNVSWNLLAPDDLIDHGDPDGDIAFNGNPEACAYPCFNWIQGYATVNKPKPDFQYLSHSDNGDGTYTNPLIHADYPDPDVIRVGDVYYMVSTTMHIFPGATILKSFDLINWEYCSNPLEMIESGSCYNLDGCNRYSHGQWATSLKYNDGRFYLFFNSLDEGNYLLSATDPEGPWEMKKLPSSFYDPGLFFDENGKTYVVYGIDNLRIVELDENFLAKPGSDQLVYTYTFRKGLEGSHLYKINGYYYIYATYGGWPAFQVALRSLNIYGPYEERKLIEDDNIHQGALVQTQTGEWWTVLFYDKGAFGRLPNLQPVTWVNNWPEIGVGGKGVTTYKKPDVGREYPVKVLPTNDNFRDYKMGMQWGWNHNPDNSRWSLFDRPDFLRLETVNVVSGFLEARNTLTQRIFGYHSDTINSFGTIKMEIDSMKEGDVAGLAVFQDPYAFIGVADSGGVRKLVMENDGTVQTGITINDSVIYLRAVANYGSSKANFYYSLDNITYTKFGSELNMKFELTIFTGNKFCIFNYATGQTGGFVDIDWFSSEEFFTEDMFYDNSFTGYSEETLTIDSLYLESDTINMLIGTAKTLKVNALFLDGHTENVTASAKISNLSPEIVTIINGQIISKTVGTASIEITFQDKLGHFMSKQLYVTSMIFPLTKELFNPSIFESGTFDEKTHTLITGTYGFGGWKYFNSIDLSEYKYLVVEFGNDNQSGVSFRLFDESSYWSTPCMYDVKTRRTIVADLHNMIRNINNKLVKADPKHLYIIGFWSYGNSPIVIDTVFVTNSDEYVPIPPTYQPLTPTSNPAYDMSDLNSINGEYVDVYTIMGVKIRSRVKAGEALTGLPMGIYIVGNKKIFIKNEW
jgi:prepilin-type processing-associated H-X9-DG protein